MKTSPNGLSFIAKWEGEVDHVYNDIAGIPTIGVGHVVRPGESFPNGISHDQAMQLLAGDVGIAENQVNTRVTAQLTQNQFDALVSFTFNCGGGSLAQSSTLRLLNQGDVQGAADGLLLWCKANIGGKLVTNQGLLRRRESERQLFLTPDGAAPVKPPPVVTPPDPPPPEPHPDPTSSNVPVNQQPLVPNETPAERIIRLVKSHVGCSLSERRDELGKLVARGVDNPEAVVTISTNCATTALGIMAEAGVRDAILNKHYVSGMAVSWVRQIGINTGALVKFDGHTMPKPGSLLRYNTPGTNNDHVEWLLGPVDANGSADHGGGGRSNNAITEGTGDIRSSWGRPLVEWWDPDQLGIPLLTQEDPQPAPPPPPPPVPAPTPPLPAPVPVPPVTPHVNQVSTLQSIVDALTWLFNALFKMRK
jgi:lysozyme